ncbi:MAG: hypothetical protein AB1393_03490 [Candidatus Edwardsbacteria bacterium]
MTSASFLRLTLLPIALSVLGFQSNSATLAVAPRSEAYGQANTADRSVEVLVLKGAEFVSGSVNIVRDQRYFAGGARLYSGLRFGCAIYEFSLSDKIEEFSISVDFVNSRNKQMDIYIYNYGTRQDNEAIRNKHLDKHWRKWESTSTGNNWHSSQPRKMFTSSGDGQIDFLGPGKKVKILFFAEGGIPYLTDEIFYINEVKIEFTPKSEIVLPQIKTSENAWIEGDFLLAKGKGYAKASEVESAKKAMAIRAAKVVALRNLAVALGEIDEKRQKALVPGARVREIHELSDGGAEVILELPLSKIKMR